MSWELALEAVLRTVSAFLSPEWQANIALFFDLKEVYGAESKQVSDFATIMKTSQDSGTPVPQAALDGYIAKLDSNDVRFAALRARIAARKTSG